VRIFWDRAGRDSNVGREQRFIYVEWEDPRDPYNRLLIDITWYADDFIERVVLPSLPEYFRRVPPLYVDRLGSGSVECEFLVVDVAARPLIVSTRAPYDLIDYTQYWRRVGRAKLVSHFRNFLLHVPEVATRTDAVEINIGNTTLLVPGEIYKRWSAMKVKFESLMRQLEELEGREQQAPKELHVEFE